MGNSVWSTLAVIVGTVPLQVNRATGRLQYAALLVARRGGSLSYAMGEFETAQRLPMVTEPRVLGDVQGFVPSAFIQPGALEQYAVLFQVAQAHEAEHKTAAARLSVEELKEQGRRQTRNPVPRQRRVG